MYTFALECSTLPVHRSEPLHCRRDTTISAKFYIPAQVPANQSGCVGTRIDQMWNNGISFCVGTFLPTVWATYTMRPRVSEASYVHVFVYTTRRVYIRDPPGTICSNRAVWGLCRGHGRVGACLQGPGAWRHVVQGHGGAAGPGQDQRRPWYALLSLLALNVACVTLSRVVTGCGCGAGAWHTITLTTADTVATGTFDGESVFTGVAVRNIDNGFALIGGSDWFAIEFDDVHVAQAGKVRSVSVRLSAAVPVGWFSCAVQPLHCHLHQPVRMERLEMGRRVRCGLAALPSRTACLVLTCGGVRRRGRRPVRRWQRRARAWCRQTAPPMVSSTLPKVRGHSRGGVRERKCEKRGKYGNVCVSVVVSCVRHDVCRVLVCGASRYSRRGVIQVRVHLTR